MNISMPKSFVPDSVATYLIESGGLNIDYVLELVSQADKQIIPLPSQPNSVNISKLYDENVLYTFKENIFREIAKSRRGTVIITGDVTSRVSLYSDGKGLFNEPGDQHLLRFEKFLQEYHARAASFSEPSSSSLDSLRASFAESTTNGAIFLVLRCFKENLHYRCVVQDFKYERNTSNHRLGGFTWTLSLALYDEHTSTDNPSFFPWDDEAKQLAQSINQIAGGFDVISSIVDGATSEIRGQASSVLGAVEGVFKSVQRLSEAPANVVSNLASIVTDAIDALDVMTSSLASTWDNVIGIVGLGDSDTYQPFRNIDNYWQSIDFFADNNYTPSRVTTPTTSTEEQALLTSQQAELQLQTNQIVDGLYGVLRVLGLYGAFRLPYSDGAYTGSTPGFLAGARGFSTLAALHPRLSVPLNIATEEEYSGAYLIYTMGAGETLMSVANSLLGDPELWTELARINNCIDGYTLGDGSPIVAGTEIRVPRQRLALMSDLGNGRLIGASDSNSDDRGGYGVDLYIDQETGDLILQEGVESIALSSNIDNLKQAIMIMVRTAIGDITADPNFGTSIQNLIGAKFTASAATLIGVRLREFLLTDPRIVEVKNIKVTPQYSEQTLIVEMDVVSFNGDQVSVILPV